MLRIKCQKAYGAKICQFTAKVLEIKLEKSQLISLGFQQQISSKFSSSFHPKSPTIKHDLGFHIKHSCFDLFNTLDANSFLPFAILGALDSILKSSKIFLGEWMINWICVYISDQVLRTVNTVKFVTFGETNI